MDGTPNNRMAPLPIFSRSQACNSQDGPTFHRLSFQLDEPPLEPEVPVPTIPREEGGRGGNAFNPIHAIFQDL